MCDRKDKNKTHRKSISPTAPAAKEPQHEDTSSQREKERQRVKVKKKTKRPKGRRAESAPRRAQKHGEELRR